MTSMVEDVVPWRCCIEFHVNCCSVDDTQPKVFILLFTLLFFFSGYGFTITCFLFACIPFVILVGGNTFS